MQAQQRRFLNVIGLSTKRALHVHKIKPMKDFLNEQRVNKESSKTWTIPSRSASIATNITTTSSCRVPTPHITKTRSCRRASASFAMGTSINTRTQDESKRPRQHIKSRSKQNSKKQDRKPNSSPHQQQQPPSSKPHHQPSARSVYSKPKISTAWKYTTAKCINKPKSLVSFP